MDEWMDGWISGRDRLLCPYLRVPLITVLSPVKGFEWVGDPSFLRRKRLGGVFAARHSQIIQPFSSDRTHNWKLFPNYAEECIHHLSLYRLIPDDLSKKWTDLWERCG